MADTHQAELFDPATLAPPGSEWDRAEHHAVLPNRAKLTYRFSAFVRIKGRQQCWPWQGARQENGYGKFYFAGGTRIASRVAFILFKGPPGDRRVCHTCDNPHCCNPAHLFLGSLSDNAQDAVTKGRWNPGGRSGVLNRNAVRVIRVFGRTRSGRRLLARHFRVLPCTVRRIAAHVTYSRYPDLVGPPLVTKKFAALLRKEQQSSRAASERVSSEATLPLLALMTTPLHPMELPS